MRGGCGGCRGVETEQPGRLPGPLGDPGLGALQQDRDLQRSPSGAVDLDRGGNELRGADRGSEPGRLGRVLDPAGHPGRGSGQRVQPESGLHDESQGAEGPGDELAEVVARDVLHHAPAGMRDASVGPHDGDADQQVAQGAVREPPRPADAGRDRAAHGPGQPLGPGRGVDGKLLRGAGERLLQVAQRRPGADHDHQVPGRVVHHAAQATGLDEHVAPGRRGRPVLLRPRPAGDDRQVVPGGGAHHLGHLIGARRARHRTRHDAAHGVGGLGRTGGAHAVQHAEHRPRPGPRAHLRTPPPRRPPAAGARPCAARAPRRRAGGREDLSRVREPVRVERAPQQLHGVQVVGGEHPRHVLRPCPTPTPCSPVIDPPCSMQRSRISPETSSARSASPGTDSSKSTSGCRLPSPAWKTLATRTPALVRQLAHPPQHLRERGPRDDPVLHEVVRADPPDRREGGLAALPDQRPLLGVGRDAGLGGAVGPAEGEHLRRADRPPRRQDRRAPPRARPRRRPGSRSARPPPRPRSPARPSSRPRPARPRRR